MEHLLLVGVVHGDPQGYDRVWKLFSLVNPDLVTVEISPFSVRYRARHGADWQQRLREQLTALPPGAGSHLAIQRLAAQVALPFEVRAARDWSRRAGIPWRPLDLGALSRRHLPRYRRELLSRENLQALLAGGDGSLEEFVAGEFRRARVAYGRYPWRPATAETQDSWKRDRVLARRLARLAARYPRLVHLGGWEHLAPWQDGRSLWSRLSPLKPRRLLLDEVNAPVEVA